MLLKRPLLIAALVLIGSIAGSQADGYDTLFLRGDSMILVAKYDTIKQLEKAEKKVDKLLSDLEFIRAELENDTIK